MATTTTDSASSSTVTGGGGGDGGGGRSSSQRSFARLWRILRRCYERNRRDLDRAYGGEVDYFEQLYTVDLGEHEMVARVVIGNRPLDPFVGKSRATELARRQNVFSAVLLLNASPRQRDDGCRLDHSWLTESRFCGSSYTVATDARRDAFARCLASAERSTKPSAAPLFLPATSAQRASRGGGDSTPSHYEADDDDVSYHRFAATVDNLRRETIYCEPAYEPAYESNLDLTVTESVAEDSTLGTYLGTSGLLERYGDHDDNSDNSDDNSDDDHRCLATDSGREASSVHDSNVGAFSLLDNYRKPAKPFQRPINTSPSKWIAEVYKSFFNAFYQDIRPLRCSEKFFTAEL